MVSVAVRFYTKLHIKHVWGLDDWLCIPAIIGTAAFAGVALSTLGHGVGPHQWDVPITAFTPSLLRRFVVLDMLYSPTILLAKLSLLALYLQIFRPNQTLRYCIYVGMIFLTLFYASTFTAYGYLSIPKRGQSQLQAILSVDTAKDIPLGITQGAVNVVSDFCILIIPIPGVLKLHLPPAKKVGVLAIFMTGLLACISGAFGLYYRVHLKRNDDVTWKLVAVLLWVVVELSVGVMCSSLPAFAGFLRYHLPLLKSIRSRLSSTFRSLRLSNLFNRSSDRASTEKLSSGNVKITFGSRIDGKGRFMNMKSMFGRGTERSMDSQIEAHTLQSDDSNNKTLRYFYEVESCQQPSAHGPKSSQSQSSVTDMISTPPHHSTPHEHTWDQGTISNSAEPNDKSTQRSWRRLPWRLRDPTGYWDLMSVFRSKGSRDGDEEKVLQSGHVSS